MAIFAIDWRSQSAVAPRNVDRQCAVCYSDFWEAYERVIPSKRHRAVGKETGKTNYIERFNCTLRQRISRLVRKAARPTASKACKQDLRMLGKPQHASLLKVMLRMTMAH